MKYLFEPYKKGIAFCLSLVILITGQTFPAFSKDVSAASNLNQESFKVGNLKHISVPDIWGEISEFHQAGKQTVILIQDAHAIPDAQKNIHALIRYFDKKYGVAAVAVEGASSALDAQIFRSFPDQKKLKKNLREYYDRSELSGAAAASIFSNQSIPFQGIEDRKLYEEAISVYLQALGQEEGLNEKISDIQEKLNETKQEKYSQELLEIDHTWENFLENQASFLDVLKTFSKFQKPLPGSHLESLAQFEAQNEIHRSSSLDAELKVAAGTLRKKLTEKNNQSGIIAFNQKQQAFQTGLLSPMEFAAWLQKAAETHSFSLELPKNIQNASRLQMRLEAIQGTRLLNELEEYAALVKKILIEQQPEERRKQLTALDREGQQMRLLRKFSNMELSRNDWVQLKKGIHSIIVSHNEMKEEDFLTQQKFYENSESREEAFMQNLNKILNSENTKRGMEGRPVIMVAGGFHAEGMTEKFKKSGISYLLVTPRISNLPEENNYRKHMAGNVSWKSYFKIENGRVRPYDAFVRALRDLLIAGEVSKVDFSLVQEWRNQIIRDLADQGRAHDAWKYTRFLDEVLLKQRSEMRGHEGMAERLSRRVDQLISGLRSLSVSQQLNQSHVSNLLHSMTAVEWTTGTASFAPETSFSSRFLDFQLPDSTEVLARSELRSPFNNLATQADAAERLKSQMNQSLGRDLIQSVKLSLQKGKLKILFETLSEAEIERLVETDNGANPAAKLFPSRIEFQVNKNQVIRRISAGNFSAESEVIGRTINAWLTSEIKTMSLSTKGRAEALQPLTARSETRKFIDLNLSDELAKNLAEELSSKLGHGPLFDKKSIEVNDKIFTLRMTQERMATWHAAEDASQVYYAHEIIQLGPLVFVVLQGNEARENIERKLKARSPLYLQNSGNVMIVEPTAFGLHDSLSIHFHTLFAIAIMLANAKAFKGAVFEDNGAGTGILSQIAFRLGANQAILYDHSPRHVREMEKMFASEGLIPYDGKTPDEQVHYLFRKENLIEPEVKPLPWYIWILTWIPPFSWLFNRFYERPLASLPWYLWLIIEENPFSRLFIKMKKKFIFLETLQKSAEIELVNIGPEYFGNESAMHRVATARPNVKLIINTGYTHILQGHTRSLNEMKELLRENSFNAVEIKHTDSSGQQASGLIGIRKARSEYRETVRHPEVHSVVVPQTGQTISIALDEDLVAQVKKLPDGTTFTFFGSAAVLSLMGPQGLLGKLPLESLVTDLDYFPEKGDEILIQEALKPFNASKKDPGVILRVMNRGFYRVSKLFIKIQVENGNLKVELNDMKSFEGWQGGHYPKNMIRDALEDLALNRLHFDGAFMTIDMASRGIRAMAQYGFVPDEETLKKIQSRASGVAKWKLLDKLFAFTAAGNPVAWNTVVTFPALLNEIPSFIQQKRFQIEQSQTQVPASETRHQMEALEQIEQALARSEAREHKVLGETRIEAHEILYQLLALGSKSADLSMEQEQQLKLRQDWTQTIHALLAWRSQYFPRSRYKVAMSYEDAEGESKEITVGDLNSLHQLPPKPLDLLYPNSFAINRNKLKGIRNFDQALNLEEALALLTKKDSAAESLRALVPTLEKNGYHIKGDLQLAGKGRIAFYVSGGFMHVPFPIEIPKNFKRLTLKVNGIEIASEERDEPVNGDMGAAVQRFIERARAGLNRWVSGSATWDSRILSIENILRRMKTPVVSIFDIDETLIDMGGQPKVKRFKEVLKVLQTPDHVAGIITHRGAVIETENKNYSGKVISGMSSEEKAELISDLKAHKKFQEIFKDLGNVEVGADDLDFFSTGFFYNDGKVGLYLRVRNPKPVEGDDLFFETILPVDNIQVGLSKLICAKLIHAIYAEKFGSTLFKDAFLMMVGDHLLLDHSSMLQNGSGFVAQHDPFLARQRAHLDLAPIAGAESLFSRGMGSIYMPTFIVGEDGGVSVRFESSRLEPHKVTFADQIVSSVPVVDLPDAILQVLRHARSDHQGTIITVPPLAPRDQRSEMRAVGDLPVGVETQSIPKSAERGNHDAMLAFEIQTVLGPIVIQGVFDGHGKRGDEAAKEAAHQMTLYLKEKISLLPLEAEEASQSARGKMMISLIQEVFQRVQQAVKFHESGTTVALALILPTWKETYVAGLGDSQVVVGDPRTGKVRFTSPRQLLFYYILRHPLSAIVMFIDGTLAKMAHSKLSAPAGMNAKYSWRTFTSMFEIVMGGIGELSVTQLIRKPWVKRIALDPNSVVITATDGLYHDYESPRKTALRWLSILKSIATNVSSAQALFDEFDSNKRDDKTTVVFSMNSRSEARTDPPHSGSNQLSRRQVLFFGTVIVGSLLAAPLFSSWTERRRKELELAQLQQVREWISSIISELHAAKYPYPGVLNEYEVLVKNAVLADASLKGLRVRMAKFEGEDGKIQLAFDPEEILKLQEAENQLPPERRKDFRMTMMASMIVREAWGVHVWNQIQPAWQKKFRTGADALLLSEKAPFQNYDMRQWLQEASPRETEKLLAHADEIDAYASFLAGEGLEALAQADFLMWAKRNGLRSQKIEDEYWVNANDYPNFLFQILMLQEAHGDLGKALAMEMVVHVFSGLRNANAYGAPPAAKLKAGMLYLFKEAANGNLDFQALRSDVTYLGYHDDDEIQGRVRYPKKFQRMELSGEHLSNVIRRIGILPDDFPFLNFPDKVSSARSELREVVLNDRHRWQLQGIEQHFGNAAFVPEYTKGLLQAWQSQFSLFPAEAATSHRIESSFVSEENGKKFWQIFINPAFTGENQKKFGGHLWVIINEKGEIASMMPVELNVAQKTIKPSPGNYLSRAKVYHPDTEYGDENYLEAGILSLIGQGYAYLTRGETQELKYLDFLRKNPRINWSEQNGWIRLQPAAPRGGVFEGLDGIEQVAGTESAFRILNRTRAEQGLDEFEPFVQEIFTNAWLDGVFGSDEQRSFLRIYRDAEGKLPDEDVLQGAVLYRIAMSYGFSQDELMAISQALAIIFRADYEETVISSRKKWLAHQEEANGFPSDAETLGQALQDAADLLQHGRVFHEEVVEGNLWQRNDLEIMARESQEFDSFAARKILELSEIQIEDGLDPAAEIQRQNDLRNFEHAREIFALLMALPRAKDPSMDWKRSGLNLWNIEGTLRKHLKLEGLSTQGLELLYRHYAVHIPKRFSAHLVTVATEFPRGSEDYFSGGYDWLQQGERKVAQFLEKSESQNIFIGLNRNIRVGSFSSWAPSFFNRFKAHLQGMLSSTEEKLLDQLRFEVVGNQMRIMIPSSQWKGENYVLVEIHDQSEPGLWQPEQLKFDFNSYAWLAYLEESSTHIARSELRFDSGVMGGDFETWFKAHREVYLRSRSQIMSEPGLSYLERSQRLSQLTDETIKKIHAAIPEFFENAATLPRIQMVATGTYGRGELALGSDLDGKILYDNAEDAQKLKPVLEFLFLATLEVLNQGEGWRSIPISDFSGERRIHPEDLTKLLDMRPVVGDAEVAPLAHEKLREYVNRNPGLAIGEFIQFWQKNRTKRGFFEGLFEREPDLKWGSGGFRDMDFSRWTMMILSNARLDPEASQRTNIVRGDEWRNAVEAHQFLLRVRFILHQIQEREKRKLSNTLPFEFQSEIAQAMGYVDGSGKPAIIEQFLGDYRKYSQTLFLFNNKVFRRALHSTGSITSYHQHEFPVHFTDQENLDGVELVSRTGKTVLLDQGIQELRNEQALTHYPDSKLNPAQLLKIFEVAAVRNYSITGELMDAIEAACPRFMEMLQDPGFRHSAMVSMQNILAAKGRTAYLLFRMQALGILPIVWPQYAGLQNRLIHDFQHRHTLDAYAIRNIDYLDQLTRNPTDIGGQGRRGFIEPLQERNLMRPLRAAILAQALAEANEWMAEELLTEFQLATREHELALWAVKNQNALVHLMRRRGLEFEEAFIEFREKVLGNDFEKWLLLLAMTDIRVHYFKPARRAVYANRLERVVGLSEIIFMDDVSMRAFVRNEAFEPLQFEATAQSEKLRVSMLRTPGESNLVKLEIALDQKWNRPGTLTRFAAALASRGVTIQTLQIGRIGDGQLTDRFFIKCPPQMNMTVENLQSLANEIHGDVEKLLNEDENPENLFKNGYRFARQKALFNLKTKVQIENKGDSTFLDLETSDRLGIVHLASRVFEIHGLNIGARSTVDTLGYDPAIGMLAQDTFELQKWDKKAGHYRALTEEESSALSRDLLYLFELEEINSASFEALPSRIEAGSREALRQKAVSEAYGLQLEWMNEKGSQALNVGVPDKIWKETLPRMLLCCRNEPQAGEKYDAKKIIVQLGETGLFNENEMRALREALDFFTTNLFGHDGRGGILLPYMMAAEVTGVITPSILFGAIAKAFPSRPGEAENWQDKAYEMLLSENERREVQRNPALAENLRDKLLPAYYRNLYYQHTTTLVQAVQKVGDKLWSEDPAAEGKQHRIGQAVIEPLEHEGKKIYRVDLQEGATLTSADQIVHIFSELAAWIQSIPDQDRLGIQNSIVVSFRLQNQAKGLVENMTSRVRKQFRREFQRLCQTDVQVAGLMRIAAELGLITAIFPPFAMAERLYDSYSVGRVRLHDYSVAAHTLYIFRAIEEAAASPDSFFKNFQEAYRRLRHQPADLTAFRFGVVVHDQGKKFVASAYETSHQMKVAQEIVPQMMKDFELTPTLMDEIRFIAWYHQHLNEVARMVLRKEPAVTHEQAVLHWIDHPALRRSTPEETLLFWDLLYIMSFGDHLGMRPSAMNNPGVRTILGEVDKIYSDVRAYLLAGSQQKANIRKELSVKQQEAQTQFQERVAQLLVTQSKTEEFGVAIPDDERGVWIQDFLSIYPTDYLRRIPDGRIIENFQFYAQLRIASNPPPEKPELRVLYQDYERADTIFWELVTGVTSDQQGIFSAIMTGLAVHELNVHEADIYTSPKAGPVIDRTRLIVPSKTLDRDKFKRDLEKEISALIAKEITPRELYQKYRIKDFRVTEHIGPGAVRSSLFFNAAPEPAVANLMKIETKNRVGLPHIVGRVLSEGFDLNIAHGTLRTYLTGTRIFMEVGEKNGTALSLERQRKIHEILVPLLSKPIIKVEELEVAISRAKAARSELRNFEDSESMKSYELKPGESIPRLAIQTEMFDSKGKSFFAWDRVRNQLKYQGRILNWGQPWPVLSRSAADWKNSFGETKEAIFMPNGNLGINAWFVGIADGKIHFYSDDDGKLEERDYSLLVTWKTGEISVANFKFRKNAQGLYRAFQGNQDMTDKIESAVYGQQIVKDGKPNWKNLVGQFHDLRHLLRLPLFERENRQIHLGFSDDLGELTANQSLVERALNDEAVTLHLAEPLRVFSISPEELHRVHQEWGYVQKENRQELKQGEYFWDSAAQELTIRFYPGIHPHSFLGLKEDDTILVGIVGGKTHFQGASLERLSQELIRRGIKNAFLWGNGKDSYLDNQGKVDQSEGARGSGISAIGFVPARSELRTFPDPTFYDPNQVRFVSYLERHVAQWAWLRQNRLEALLTQAKSEAGDAKRPVIRVAVIGSSTGEEIARTWYEIAKFLQSKGEKVARNSNEDGWRIQITGVDREESLIERAKSNLKGKSAFYTYTQKQEPNQSYIRSILKMLSEYSEALDQSIQFRQVNVIAEKNKLADLRPHLVLMNLVFPGSSISQYVDFVSWGAQNWPQADIATTVSEPREPIWNGLAQSYDVVNLQNTKSAYDPFNFSYRFFLHKKITGKPADQAEESEDGDKKFPLTREIIAELDYIDADDLSELRVFNKPKGYETYFSLYAHPSRGLTLYQFFSRIKNPFPGIPAENITALGRLDRDTTGVFLIHPQNKKMGRRMVPHFFDQIFLNPAFKMNGIVVGKTYSAVVHGKVQKGVLDKLKTEGIEINVEGEKIRVWAREIELVQVGERSSVVRMVIDEGRNHQVKKMLAGIGHAVLSLRREKFGEIDLTAENSPDGSLLREGDSRPLSRSEKKWVVHVYNSWVDYARRHYDLARSESRVGEINSTVDIISEFLKATLNQNSEEQAQALIADIETVGLETYIQVLEKLRNEAIQNLKQNEIEQIKVFTDWLQAILKTANEEVSVGIDAPDLVSDLRSELESFQAARIRFILPKSMRELQVSVQLPVTRVSSLRNFKSDRLLPTLENKTGEQSSLINSMIVGLISKDGSLDEWSETGKRHMDIMARLAVAALIAHKFKNRNELSNAQAQGILFADLSYFGNLSQAVHFENGQVVVDLGLIMKLAQEFQARAQVQRAA